MMGARKTQARSKSKIAVRKGSALQNKENVPNNANKKEIEKKTAKSSTWRKTLSSKKDESSHDKPVAKIKRAKTAPDFAKLHKNWEANFAKGKAVTKRPVTKVEPFRLTKEVNAGLEDTDFDNLDVEDEESVDTWHQKTSENVQEITTACCSCGKQKSPGQKATTLATTIRKFKVPTSIRKANLSSVKKKEKKEENQEIDQDLFEFKPDNKALQSILNHDGVRFTPRKTNTGAYCSPSPFNQKRTSIYCTGPRLDRSPTPFEKRLSMRRAAAMMAKMKEPENSFQPSNTLIGIQECGNRFTTATQFNELENDYNRNSDCIPEETSEYNTTHNGDTITYATGSTHIVENEISWAETLKYYSQSQQENDFSIEEENEEDEDVSQLEEEDKEALIAQLEEEVRQTLSDVALIDYTNHPEEQHSVPSAIKPEPEIIGNPNASIPLQQSREKPSIYRRLFTSPSHVQSKQSMTEENIFTPGYLRTANVTRNLTSNPSNMVEQSCNTKPSAIDMAGSSGPATCRLPVDNTLCSLQAGTGYTAEHHRFPNCVSFSPSVTVFNQLYDMQSASKIATSNIGVEEEISGNYSTLHDLQTFSGGNTWVSGPAIKGDNKMWVAKSAFVIKDGDTNLHSHVSRGISTTKSLGNETGGSLSVEKPPVAEKGCAPHTSLVAAATASLNWKLKKRGFETKSAFHTFPHNMDGTKPLSARNPCISSNEQKILIPTPMKPVVARNHNRSHEMASIAGGFISRHRQIMHDALVKSRDHAQEVLLDAEVSLYARNIEYIRKYDGFPRLTNPLAKIFNEGDEKRFVPIELA